MAPADRSMPAVRMIRVWPEREHRDDGDLGEHQRQVGGGEEPGVDDREGDDRDDQDGERPEDRVAVQQVLEAQAERVVLADLEVGVAVLGAVVVMCQPQQFCLPHAESLASTPACGSSVISWAPVSTKSLPAVACGLVPSLANAAIASMPSCGHLERELHRGRADDARRDVVDAGAAAVDRDDGDVLVLAGRLERLVRPGRRGLVDRVDQVDRRVLLQQVLHRRTPAVLGAVGHVVARDPRVVLVADLVGVADRDAEAVQEALVPLDVDGDLVGVEVQHGDLRLLAVLVELGLRPLPDQLAGLVVVGGEGGVGGVRPGRSACPGR